jgi:hypothetical protein
MTRLLAISYSVCARGVNTIFDTKQPNQARARTKLVSLAQTGRTCTNWTSPRGLSRSEFGHDEGDGGVLKLGGKELLKGSAKFTTPGL